ncbi:MAG: hypothetical protein ACKOW8_09595, partial [Flavobacteriales bacterium]
MTPADTKTRKILTVLAIVALICLLYAVRNVVVYMVLGLVISLICEPLVTLTGKLKIRGHSLPISIRALLAMMVFISFLMGVIWVF